ncbi:MAG TPA: glycosyltransferase family 4 protein [Steroidobacteraceae bacterium]|nr:glycosyltransferase family 4 protein [Steroidobacteraceae bacterium]
MGIVFGFFLSIFVLWFCALLDTRMLTAFLVASGAVALVGLLDDLYSLPVYVRFGVHIGAAIFAVLVIGELPQSVLENWGVHDIWIGFAAIVLIILAGINFFNFMDGIDGIAGSEAIFVCAAGALLNFAVGGDSGVTASMLCLAAASLGFLVWNWPPASIFMGDVGSGFLGINLALLGLSASYRSAIPMEVWPILGGVFLVDATITLTRRMARGDRWLEPHRLHGYQHLARRMKSHLSVTLIVIATDVFWLLPWAWFAVCYPRFAKLALAAALTPLVVIAFFLGAGRREH